MAHPYLKLTFSDTYSGRYVVGKTAQAQPWGDGLTNESVKVVEIPSSFSGIEIAEIGNLAFYLSEITSVFIPKTILNICRGAFNGCRKLTEVRFEKGSMLQRLNYNVFYYCTSLKKIDFPASVSSILSDSWNIFFANVNLECFSYEGITDFSSLSHFFYSVTNVYVSNEYPASTFAGKEITEKGKTCGVSKEHLEKQKTIQTICIRRVSIIFLLRIYLIIPS